MSLKLNGLLSGLLLLTSASAFSLGEQEIAFVHSVNTLGVNFDEVPAIVQNADTFTALFEMHVNALETRVESNYSAIKSALLKNSALLTTALFVRAGLTECASAGAKVISNNAVARYMTNVVLNGAWLAMSIGGTLTALNLYDVFKEKNALKAELALNQEILDKLHDVQAMSAFIEHDNSQIAHDNDHNEASESTQEDSVQE